MNNNQDSIKNPVYQYTVTANSDINYNIAKSTSPTIPVKVITPNLRKENSKPALARATQALRLVNPFKGV